MLVTYQYAVANFFCQKDYRELISGPIKFAIILFAALFLFRFAVAVVFFVQDRHTPREEFDYNSESRWRLTIIFNQSFDVACLCTWVYVLFKLKRIEIQMNPKFSSIEQV